jgi:hypothetical protein
LPLQDVVVSINVKSPAPKIGLGRPVIFVQKIGATSYEEYATLEALLVDYATSTDVYKKAATIFKQTNRPDVVAVATYDTDIELSLAEYYNRPWHFALIANDLLADQLGAAQFITDKDFKFVVAQVEDDASREALKPFKRVIVADHNVIDEHLDAAAVGELASQTVGSITWKFKQLKGITPRYLNDTEMAAIDADSAIAYVVKGGIGQLSEGWLSNGEYIDDVHGQDWIKVDMENEVSRSLSQSPKAPYDARGIALIEAAATTTLQRGFTNGVIGLDADGLPNYTISALSREQTDPQDRALRIYKGLSWSYGRSGAIHGALISGEVLI